MVVCCESGKIGTCLGSILYGSGHYGFYLPIFVYDLAVLLFFPINWLITFIATYVIAKCQQHDHKGTQQKDDLQAIKQHILSKSKIPLNNNQLVALFDSLPVATTSDMIGYWSGNIVRSRSLLDVADMTLCQAQYLGFSWGKRYRSPFIGDPLVLSFLNTIHLPIFIWGNVQLNDIEYRGKVNATMVYDHQPWQDYFRVLDDGSVSGNVVILGIWATRHAIGGWFTLTANTSATSALASHHRITTSTHATQHPTIGHVPNLAQQLATAATHHPINANKRA